jgi:hypothetical protein
MPDHYDDPEENEDPFASGPTPAQPGDDKVNPFDPNDPFASGPTPAQPGDEDVNPFASNEPMEEGLEDIDGDDSEDEEEKKPPIQRLVKQPKIRLPGAKGPLEVDSIGDYLEDVDWSAIDSEARSRAEESYPDSPPQQMEEMPTQQEPPSELADEPPPEPPEDPVTGDDIARAADNLGIGHIGKFSTNAAPTGSFQPVGLPQNPMLPPSSPATPEHLARQQQIDLADYGSNGPSSFSQPGHNQTAKEDAVERATDAINTATGRIVDVLTVLAQVMNNHSHRIAQVEDQLDMESERDVS